MLALPSLGLLGCVRDQVVAEPAQPPGKLEPAPMPRVHFRGQASTVGSLELPIPPKMPLGTGAVPVSNSPVRGSVVTGFRQGF